MLIVQVILMLLDNAIGNANYDVGHIFTLISAT